MAKRKVSAAVERAYYGRVAALGCIICKAPAEVHHLTGAGMGLRAKYLEVIPLCHKHHRTGGHGVAVHAGTKTWEANFGTQEELLIKTIEALENGN